MAETQTIFGQADAVALELVQALNDASDAGAFCLELAAERRFDRLLDIKVLPASTSPVNVQVFPGHDQADRSGIMGTYDDTYGVHVLFQQMVPGVEATACPLLLQLRSEVAEFVLSKTLTTTAAVHPFANAHVVGHRHGPEGLYDLNRMEELHAWYSDLILTYKVPGLRRNGG